MKSILISIKPKWCKLIASGKKAIEVLKTRPKIETPFKCYIYCTKPKQRLSLNGSLFCFEDDLAILNRPGMPKIENPWGALGKDEMLINGMVIGEFVCDGIITSHGVYGDELYHTGLSYDELQLYGKGKPIFGWHISDLVIYDQPKELSEFHRPCAPSCNFSEECGGVQDGEHCPFSMKRPPQSWCYVEV